MEKAVWERGKRIAEGVRVRAPPSGGAKEGGGCKMCG